MENLGPYTNFHELNQDWFLSEFNKLVEQWKAMQKNFDNLQDAFNDLKSYVQDYFKNLDVQDEINNKIDSLVANGYFDTFLNDYFKNLKKRVFILIGDSYGENPYEYKGGWTTPFKSFSGLTEGVDCFTNCVGGTGFVKTGNTGKTFLDLLKDIKIGTVNPKDVTDILVCGGCNDVDTSFNNLNTAILSFRNYCKQHFVNANINISMIGIFKASGRRKLLLSTVLRSYQLAVNYGMRYIDSTCCLHRYDFIGEDGIHPTSAGCINIGRNLCNALFIGQGVQLINYNEESLSGGTDITYGGTNKFYGFSNNGVIYFGMIKNTVLSFRTTIKITNNSDIVIGNLKYSTLLENNNYPNTIPVQCVALQTSGNTVLPGYIYATDDGSKISLHLVIPNVTNEISSCKQLQILPFETTIIF
jgi:hypothetical protein